ncbi:HEAT repeat domain-containing protein [Desulfogranum japonicum]|uniref:HEAT repeat domain-containing protein n=1 Tax=Desulfogranum japonicum TaxID=231447 RepID=UPI000408BAB9|nr:HEAT repeat domain-containing protein [Desulfogranum japonicum]
MNTANTNQRDAALDPAPPQAEVSDEELLHVMADFLAMGHVENIVAMFRQEDRYFEWVGKLLQDERFAVRLGVAVLFEYLLADSSSRISLALPSLARSLQHKQPWVRGEAANILGIINTPDALQLINTIKHDSDQQVREIAADILGNTPDE